MDADNPNFMAAVALQEARERVASAIEKLEDNLTLISVIQISSAQQSLAKAAEELFKVEMRNPRKNLFKEKS